MEKITATSAPCHAGSVPVEAEASAADLPRRRAPDCRVIQSVRRMDDPEILERILEGLLELE